MKRPWCCEILKAGGEGDDRGWDGWMASPTQWTWIWVNSGSWWWTGRPGMLQSMGSQRIGHNWVTELNRSEWMDFPGGSDGKESACNAGDLGSIPGLERSLGKRNGNSLRYSCLENFTEEPGGLQSMGKQKSQTWKWLNHHHHMPKQKYT